MKVDYLYALENILPTKKLRRVILSITLRCNSRCKTCSIWKKKDWEELSLDDIKKLTKKKFFKGIRFLTLTGGEPFLRKDIDEIVRVLKKENPKLHITILTNALLPKIIAEKVRNMPKDVLITMSFNGKEKTHDETRGVRGNFKKLLQTIDLLKKLNRNMSLIFTVTKENYDQLLWAWNFAKKHNLNILFSPEMDYERLTPEKGRELTNTQKKKVIEQLKKIYSERKRWFFDYTYLVFFKRFYERKTITDKCYAGVSSIYIDYNGNVYPCENLVGIVKPFGNIKKEINIPKDYSKIVKKSGCYKDCYLLCEMIRNMRRHPLRTLLK